MKPIDHEALALKSRRTKIIATLGPASSSPAVINRLLEAGMDVVRLNMSHGTHDSHRILFKRVRAAARRAGRHIAVVMDLCGPKIRVGRFADGGIQLTTGDEVIVTSRNVLGAAGLIPSQYRQLHKDVKKGERILLDDGNLELHVLSVDGTEVSCRVIHGGLLKDHKGMNLPDSALSTPAFTNKDKKDVLLAMELEVEYVALSFVRNAGDVIRLNRYMARHGEPIPVISKIERPEAVENLDEILDVSDGVMVARGDLGIELPAERVPMIQRNIIKRARAAYVPVIVATQMLESMITHSRPTRAEVGDVASAAHSSTDAVMLSGETASGAYPVEAVETMDRVAREIEKHQWRDGQYGSQVFADRHRSGFSLREAVSHAALELARDMAMQAILVPTRSGTTARILSAHRTTAPLVGICANARICRRLSLHWGVIPVFVKEPQLHDWHSLCLNIKSQCDLSRPGHTVLLVSGFSDDPASNEPVLKTIKI
ncbi:MAG: pyruvate kinase [Gammaproteobacteria bacterium]|nr:pyruvate kinase [Gammaproteobacteria bacterium]